MSAGQVIVAAALAALAFQARSIHDAARTGDVSTVVALADADRLLVQSADNAGRTPLHWACRGVHVDVVKALVERGADVNALDGAGVAPLHSVASRGHTAAAALLVERGARVDVAMRDGATPLHLSARGGHLDTAALLLASGAPLGARDGSEDSPLHAAARARQWAIVDLMVDAIPTGHTALLNRCDFDGSTALHLVAGAGRVESAAKLIAKGADLDVRNTMGHTAHSLASEGGFTEVAAVLARAGADGGPARFPRLTGPYLGQTPPGTTPRIFAKGIVSTRQGVYGTIVFSLDHGDAYWKPESDRLLCSKVENGVWSPPRVFPFSARPAINVPFLSPDGRRLLFMTGGRNAAGMDEDEAIWFAERIGGGWSEPKSLDPAVNSVKMHWQFSMDRRGDIYLSAAGGIACARFVNGRYLPPERLPAPVNAPHTPEEKYRAGEIGPFIAPDGDYLLFTKFGPGGGLRIAFRQPDGSWGEPANLSARLGTAGNDSAPQVTPDGKYLFFQSVRPGSAPSRSFYWVDARVIEALRPASAAPRR